MGQDLDDPMIDPGRYFRYEIRLDSGAGVPSLFSHGDGGQGYCPVPPLVVHQRPPGLDSGEGTRTRLL